MRFHVMTLFPDLIREAFGTSITGGACEKGLLSLNVVNIRDYANNKHHKVDDYTYGGGAGLLMQAEPIYQAYVDLQKKFAKRPRVVYVTPQGQLFHQDLAKELAREEELVFLCGHYEGIDERVLEEIVTDYISIGDYVLTGGELPALVMMDAISRLVPGVLHNEESAETESFQGNLLEYPQYSRPEVWHGKKVPEVLLTGDHRKIEVWRRNQAEERTRLRRPDLYAAYERRLACENQLLRQKLLHMDMLESLRTDQGQIFSFTEEGVLLVDWEKETAYLTAENERTGKQMLENLAEILKAEGSARNLSSIILHQEFLCAEAGWILGFSNCQGYKQYVYTQRHPRPLDRKISVRFMEDRQYGAFVDGGLKGVLKPNKIGAVEFHSEKGTASQEEITEALEVFWIKQLLQNGRTPFCWIREEDDFCRLQEKLGLHAAKGKIWLLKA